MLLVLQVNVRSCLNARDRHYSCCHGCQPKWARTVRALRVSRETRQAIVGKWVCTGLQHVTAVVGAPGERSELFERFRSPLIRLSCPSTNAVACCSRRPRVSLESCQVIRWRRWEYWFAIADCCCLVLPANAPSCQDILDRRCSGLSSSSIDAACDSRPLAFHVKRPKLSVCKVGCVGLRCRSLG